MRLMIALMAAFAWIFVSSHCVRAFEPADTALCQTATAKAEHLSGVPDQLLDAISRVESGRYDSASGTIHAWPWTINEEGIGHFYASKQEAVEAAQQFRARGIQSIDVGCTQINLMFHPNAFASLEDAFDPTRNAAFAAQFLTDLFHQVGSWPHAAAAYHSQTPELGTDYQRKVLEAWAEPINSPEPPSRARPGGFRLTDFHRQLASLSGSAAMNRPTAASFTPGHALPRPLGAPLGGYGRVLHSTTGQGAVTGRSLAAYRAMPVAMLMTPRRLARY